MSGLWPNEASHLQTKEWLQSFPLQRIICEFTCPLWYEGSVSCSQKRQGRLTAVPGALTFVYGLQPAAFQGGTRILWLWPYVLQVLRGPAAPSARSASNIVQRSDCKPRFTADCGHCRSCVLATLEGPGIAASQCPVCQQPCWKKDLVAHHQYQAIADLLCQWLQAGEAHSNTFPGPVKHTPVATQDDSTSFCPGLGQHTVCSV